MQLLIVHDDAEVAEQLARMVKDYTTHDCDFLVNDAAALAWAGTHSHCRLLITQLEAANVDGLALGGSLSERFPGLQTLFLPAYSATDQLLEITNGKVFPEPIDGERLLNTIERASLAPNGAPDLFHVMDVLQMCCLSGCTGAIQVVKKATSGIVFLRYGKIVHAEAASARGTAALFEITSWELVEFAYDRSFHQAESIAMPWDETLVQAVARRREEKIASAALPGAEGDRVSASPFNPRAARQKFLGNRQAQ